MTIQKFVPALLAMTLSIQAQYSFADDMRWFKNELTCADTKVIVHSYCRNEPNYSANTFCVEQSITLEKAEGKKITQNFLNKEPSRGDFHSVRSLACVAGDHAHYLYVSLGNGGNCDTCENDAVMDLRGRWRRYGSRWYAPKRERAEIASHEQRWFKQGTELLENKIEDRGFKHD